MNGGQLTEYTASDGASETAAGIPYFCDNPSGAARYTWLTAPRHSPSFQLPRRIDTDSMKDFGFAPSATRLVTALLTCLLIASTLSSASQARQVDPLDDSLLRAWMNQQRSGFSRIERLAIDAEVHHIVDLQDGERVANYGFHFEWARDREEGKNELVYFVTDGDSLDVSERRRVDRVLSSMMSPELGPILNGLNLPARMVARARVIGDPTTVRIGDREAVRFMFEMQLPDRDAQARMQAPGGRRPGGARRGGRPPNGMRPQPNGERPSPPRFALFIDSETGALLASRVRLRTKGDRELTAETVFTRIEGIDLPVSRSVSGSFSMQRRLRTVTVGIDHETRFHGYVLETRD